MKAPDFGRLIRHHGRGARWQVPTAYDGQWWHLHRPDGAQRTGLWRSADSASLLEGDPGDPVVVGDGREVEVVQFLTGGSSAAVVVRPAGGERLEMWWLKGGERRWGEVVVSGVSPWAKPVLDEWGRVVCCPEVSDGRRRQVLRWSGA
ncbi:hypothetical protein, partial [Austwickia sp. TVS 96-490-7B]|uniref:hypothetical protein n=1 Tax=Austwickia sp. TVS 96-490-7B TaxID=2830843 RepID=UPI001C562894